ncbi:hypothetical protein HU200_008411 [Digitaria exilis]|uniref:Uncharacterized protein n=1 Tax=Digitaria exilis TaxID=1010633 RepID=A0A835FML4_9POAL|nr:hypothetical protein HU200_008411 [Digitaria exilis]
MVGLAALCWAIWKSQNSKHGDKEAMEAGAEAIKATALHFHPHEAPADDAGT